MDATKRSYEMRARKHTTAATRAAIVRAAIDSVVAARSLGITLSSVADCAGVTVKTVLRHFGSLRLRDVGGDSWPACRKADGVLLIAPVESEEGCEIVVRHGEISWKTNHTNTLRGHAGLDQAGRPLL